MPASDVKEKLQQIQAENPAIEFGKLLMMPVPPLSASTSVAETLLLGVVLTMAVLFLFFGDFKASLIVGASMPFPVPDPDPYECDGILHEHRNTGPSILPSR